MVATTDVGVFAAEAFERPDDYIGRAIAIAGDELTGPQIAALFQEVTGISARFEEQPLDEVRAFSQDLGRMFEWLTSAATQPTSPGYASGSRGSGR